jgi:hypothetical protein
MKAKLIKRDDNFYSLKLDGIVMATSNGMLVDYNLSKQNCDEIFSIVDVERLAENIVTSHPDFKSEGFSDYQNGKLNGIIEGFNKAMELNKDKVFTILDISYAIAVSGKMKPSEIVKNLREQPTEIEVEIEMETISSGRIIIVDYSHINNPKIISEKPLGSKEQRPKLDSSGCLILKRVV